MTRTVFRNANLLDGDNPAVPNATIVVDGDTITHAGKGDFRDARPTDRVIDLGGRTLMPGMLTCHYHAAYHNVGAGTIMPVGMESPIGLQAIRGAANLRTALDCGYTGAVSAGASNGIDSVLMRALNEGLIEGPRFIPCSRDVGTTGHSADLMMQRSWLSSFTGNFNRADGPNEMRRAVREEVRDGAQFVKLFVTGGHGVGTPERMEMTAEEMKVAIETAHERGARARGHIATKEAVLLAIEYGMDVIDHGDGIDEECNELLVAKNIPVAPSMVFMNRIIQLMPKETAARMTEAEAGYAEAFRQSNKAGVKLILGDDYGVAVMPHGEYSEELDYYVNQVGIPPLDVIRWATKNGGELFKLDKPLGVIAPGSYADLLVVDGDPIADIRVLKDRSKLLAIMKNGAFWKDELAGLAARDGSARAAQHRVPEPAK